MGLTEYEPGTVFPGLIGRTADESSPAWPRRPNTQTVPYVQGGRLRYAIPDYQPPFAFTGTLHTVTLDLSGDLITSTEAEIRIAMARQ